MADFDPKTKIDTFFGSDPLFGQDPNSGKPKVNLNDDLALRMRQVVSDAYAFVRGRETVASFSATTFEDLAQQQITRLTGRGTDTRPNSIARVQKIQSEIENFAVQIKNTPPDAFLPPDSNKDVNTPSS